MDSRILGLPTIMAGNVHIFAAIRTFVEAGEKHDAWVQAAGVCILAPMLVLDKVLNFSAPGFWRRGNIKLVPPKVTVGNLII